MWLEVRAASRASLILALETSCDDTCAAVIDGAEIRSNVISSQAAAHERFGGVVPGGRRASPPRARQPGGRGGARRGRRRARGGRLARGHPGPGADRRVAGRCQHRQGARRGDRQAAVGRRPPAGARGRELPRARPARAAVPLPDRQRRAHAARRGHRATTASRCSARRSTTPPARRSTRRRGCSGSAIPGGPAIEREAADGDPEAFELPIAMTNDPRLDFSFSGLKTALLYARPRARRRGRGEAPRRPRGELSGRRRRPAGGQAAPRARVAAASPAAGRRLDAVALGGGVAANSLLRERVAALCEREGLRAEARRRPSSAPTTRR